MATPLATSRPPKNAPQVEYGMITLTGAAVESTTYASFSREILYCSVRSRIDDPTASEFR
jgi:hypothetical protein